jgi:hypothetical protein
LQKVSRERYAYEFASTLPRTHVVGAGYKVGRVDQAETALGAEMRLAADKSKGKVSADKGKDKIVRRCVPSFALLNAFIKAE